MYIFISICRALISILKLIIIFFEIFQIEYSYVVNSKKVGGRPPPLPPPPSNKGPDGGDHESGVGKSQTIVGKSEMTVYKSEVLVRLGS